MQANGLDERWNQTLQNMLVKFVHCKKSAWGSFLDTCVFAYNTSRHESTHFTPFELMFNRQATLPIDVEFRKALPKEVASAYLSLEEPDMAKLAEERARRLEEAKQNILQAQQKQKEMYDKKHAKPECYKIGQLVLKKDFTRRKRKGGKLEIRFLGPYAISKVLPHGTYELTDRKSTVRVTGAHLKLYHPASPPSSPKDDPSPSLPEDDPFPSPPDDKSSHSIDGACPSEDDLNDSLESIPPLPPPMPSLDELKRRDYQPAQSKDSSLPQPAQSNDSSLRQPVQSKDSSLPQPPNDSSKEQPSIPPKARGSRKRRNSAAYRRDAKRRQIANSKEVPNRRDANRRQIGLSENSKEESYDVDTHVPQQPPVQFWKKELNLTDDERQILNHPQKWLNDSLITAGQNMLKKQYGDRVSGLQDVVKLRTLSMDIEPNEFVQILNKSDNHWFTISTIGCKPGVVNIYDSASKYITRRNKEEIAALLNTGEDTITIQYMNVQHQYGGSDCGLFALAFATTLSTGMDPTACTFNQELMREHFLSCINKGQLDHFPLKHTRRPILQPVKLESFDIHCHCRMPENPRDRMILCNGSCKQWYHDTCEHVEDNIWNSRLRWYCTNCKN